MQVVAHMCTAHIPTPVCVVLILRCPIITCPCGYEVHCKSPGVAICMPAVCAILHGQASPSCCVFSSMATKEL